MTKILVVEDEKIIGEMIRMYLTDEEFTVHRVENGKEALAALSSFDPEVILLDLMLPDIDGYELCVAIRERTDTPIIVISAKSKVGERIQALESGADDYLTKPFSMQELKARIGVAVRRYKPVAAAASPGSPPSGRGPKEPAIRIEPQQRFVYVHNQPIETTFSEFELLKLFFKHPGRVFTRDELINELRGIDSYINERSIDVHITNLRKKIEPNPKEPQFIKTVWGVGYKLLMDE